MAGLSMHNPWPDIKLKGKRHSGIIYQHAVTKYLRRQMVLQGLEGEIIGDQWLYFYDANGKGHAQPDIYIIFTDYILLMECKLSARFSAHEQMAKLYKPLLIKIYDLPVYCLQVCKVLRREVDEKLRIYTLNEALAHQAPQSKTWHLLP